MVLVQALIISAVAPLVLSSTACANIESNTDYYGGEVEHSDLHSWQDCCQFCCSTQKTNVDAFSFGPNGCYCKDFGKTSPRARDGRTSGKCGSSGPGPWKYLTWSYAMDASAPLLVSGKANLFDLQESDVKTDPNPYSYVETVTHSEGEAITNELGVSVDAHGAALGISAEASTKFSRVYSSEHHTFKSSRYGKSRRYMLGLKEHDAYLKLTPSSKKFLLEKSPESIRSEFGDFYVTSGHFGGIFASSYVTVASKEDTKSSVQASIKTNWMMAGVTFGVSSKLDTSKYGLDTFFQMSASGGDERILQGTDPKDALLAQKRWAETLSDDKLAPVTLTLKPIWELLQGRYDSKAKEIEDYLTKKWADAADSVPKNLPYTLRNCQAKDDGSWARRQWCNEWGGRRRRNRPRPPSGWAYPIGDGEWCPDGCRWGGQSKKNEWCDDNGGYWFCDIDSWVPGMEDAVNASLAEAIV